jgi:FkbM family methyltransferase
MKKCVRLRTETGTGLRRKQPGSLPDDCVGAQRASLVIREDTEMAITENMPVADIFMEKCYLSNGLVLHSNPRTPLQFLFTDIFVRQEYTNPHIPAIKPNDVVIDIGASIGMFSLYAASLSPSITVYAFEPAADTFAVLQKNIAANNLANVHCQECAVSSTTGELPFYMDSGSLGDSAIQEWIGKENVVASGRVVCISLDELFARFKIAHCDFLKVDCEGSEFDIFAAASAQTLRAIAAIALECHECRGRKSQELMDILGQAGFDVSERKVRGGISMIYAKRPTQ